MEIGTGGIWLRGFGGVCRRVEAEIAEIGFLDAVEGGIDRIEVRGGGGGAVGIAEKEKSRFCDTAFAGTEESEEGADEKEAAAASRWLPFLLSPIILFPLRGSC